MKSAALSGSAQAAKGSANIITPVSQPLASLPVFDSVAAYEKLHRIGEGTYGVVCERSARMHGACLPLVDLTGRR